MESEVADVQAATVKRVSEPLQALDEWLQQDAARVDAESSSRQDENEVKQGKVEGIHTAESSSQAINQPTFEDMFGGGDLTSSGNHIGRLLEYRQANPSESGPVFTDMSQGINFAFKVKIGESEEPFGASPVKYFPNKKAAKQYACRLAVEWLVQNNFMPATGVKFPKPKATPPAATKPMSHNSGLSNPVFSPSGASGGPTAASRVPTLCHQLGLPVPTYVLEQNPEFPSLFSGHAHFGGDPRVSGEIGAFSNIFGKKNAKEACAAELVNFLESMRDQRAALDEAERERLAAL